MVRGVLPPVASLLVLSPSVTAQSQTPPPSRADALLVEWLGAGGSSFVVSGLYLSAFEEGACGDDFGCTFSALSGLAVLSAGASVLGVELADRIASTDGSLWGAFAGAAVGTAGGFLAAMHLGDRNDFTRALSLGLTQGLGAAIGSRIGAALR